MIISGQKNVQNLSWEYDKNVLNLSWKYDKNVQTFSWKYDKNVQNLSWKYDKMSMLTADEEWCRENRPGVNLQLYECGNSDGEIHMGMKLLKPLENI